MKPLRPMGLTTKFLLGVGIIVIFFWCIFNLLIFVTLKDSIMTQTYEKADLLFLSFRASQNYIKNHLRPALFKKLPEGDFLLEGMSVSFFSKTLSETLKNQYPAFRYRRVALNPRNPLSRPDEIEKALIERFRHSSTEKIQEIVTIEGKRHFLQARPIKVEKSCLQCHGKVSDAPEEIIKRYGSEGGFNWKEGEIIGVETIAIPIEEAFNRASQLVVSIFITGLLGVFFLFVSLNYYINRIAVSPIKRISRFFKSVVQGQEGLTTRFPVTSSDEIGELARSFNQMIDHLRESQERLRISEQKYRRVFEDSKDTIMVADCDGFIIDINPAGVDMFGCKRREHIIKTKSIYDLFPSPEEYTKFVEKMKKEGFVKDYETVLRTVDGRTINALITATLRYNEEDKLCGFDAIIKDITAWKKLQEQMARADKLASVGQLAAGVAHEINNPLGIIMGYTGMLLSEDGLPPEVKEDLKTVYQNAETCKKIIEDLLKFSRQSPAKPEPVDLNALIEEVSSLLAYQIEEKEIMFEKELQDIPLTMADPDKLRQVIMNIILNAIQAVEIGGSVKVKTFLDKTGFICIEITDNGHGIPEELQSKVFEPFFTTKPPGQGTGLGLAVSYGIVKEHGGTITFESSPKKGTTFRVYMPGNE